MQRGWTHADKKGITYLDRQPYDRADDTRRPGARAGISVRHVRCRWGHRTDAGHVQWGLPRHEPGRCRNGRQWSSALDGAHFRRLPRDRNRRAGRFSPGWQTGGARSTDHRRVLSPGWHTPPHVGRSGGRAERCEWSRRRWELCRRYSQWSASHSRRRRGNAGRRDPGRL